MSHCPDWVEDLLLAEEWHMPPWEIEDKAPLLWVERWEALHEARSLATKQQSKGESLI